jgi:hypothetical protein
MSQPNFIVLPVSSDSVSDPDKETAESRSAGTYQRLPSLNAYIVFVLCSRFNNPTCAIRKSTSGTRTPWTVQANHRYKSDAKQAQGSNKVVVLILMVLQLIRTSSISTLMSVLTEIFNYLHSSLLTYACSGRIQSVLWAYISVL